MIAEGEFIEHAQFSGNFYGTSFMTIKNVSGVGRRCILDIESEVSRQRLCIHPTSVAEPKYDLIRVFDKSKQRA